MVRVCSFITLCFVLSTCIDEPPRKQINVALKRTPIVTNIENSLWKLKRGLAPFSLQTENKQTHMSKLCILIKFLAFKQFIQTLLCCVFLFMFRFFFVQPKKSSCCFFWSCSCCYDFYDPPIKMKYFLKCKKAAGSKRICAILKLIQYDFIHSSYLSFNSYILPIFCFYFVFLVLFFLRHFFELQQALSRSYKCIIIMKTVIRIKN